ncbi:hypothetical protein AA313_de0203937 [Arthrobotrys entomopaga]|nr:hypothetical protein AA313_de0203937 [Arthrobotrys entomopaga]
MYRLSPKFRRSRQPAFIMECCGKRGDSVGCKVGRHRAQYRGSRFYDRDELDEHEGLEALPRPVNPAVENYNHGVLPSTGIRSDTQSHVSTGVDIVDLTKSSEADFNDGGGDGERTEGERDRPNEPQHRHGTRINDILNR